MKNYYENNKKGKRNIKEKGFVIVVSACLLAIGAAGYITVQKGTEKTDMENLMNTVSVPQFEREDILLDVGAPQSDVTAESPVSTPSEKESVTEKTEDVPYVKAEYIMPVKDGNITLGFSTDTPVFNETMGDYRMHTGIDISAKEGTDVTATADGTVEDVYNDDIKGVTVTIKHSDGVISVYNGLSEGVFVTASQEVNQGDKIGTVGNTAYFETDKGAHIHFEMIKNGENLNPLMLIKE